MPNNLKFDLVKNGNFMSREQNSRNSRRNTCIYRVIFFVLNKNDLL